jgi:hypothetical protein
VIGLVQKSAGHVHLAEIDDGMLVNPLLRIGGVLYRWMPGRYAYDLTPSGLDTTRLANGPCVVTVPATDTRGHMGVLSTSIYIRN